MAKKPALTLVSSFSSHSHPSHYTIRLNSDHEEDAHLDTAYLSAVRIYVSQKIRDLKIPDHKVFVHEDIMEVFFRTAADRDAFAAAFENRANHEITTKIRIEGRTKRHQLEDFAGELAELAGQFHIGEDVCFTVPDGAETISMTAANRDVFVTFFQEYEHAKNGIPFSRLIDPDDEPTPAP
jgi:hypothetical protein